MEINLSEVKIICKEIVAATRHRQLLTLSTAEVLAKAHIEIYVP